jgi:hypothetical protein
MSTKSDRVLKVLRFIVYRSLIGNFHLKAKYINTAFNSIADALSRAQFQKFKKLSPHADSSPTMDTLSMNFLKWSFLLNFYIVVQKYQKLVWNHRR